MCAYMVLLHRCKTSSGTQCWGRHSIVYKNCTDVSKAERQSGSNHLVTDTLQIDNIFCYLSWLLASIKGPRPAFLLIAWTLMDCTTLCTIGKVWYTTNGMIDIVPVIFRSSLVGGPFLMPVNNLFREFLDSLQFVTVIWLHSNHLWYSWLTFPNTAWQFTTFYLWI